MDETSERRQAIETQVEAAIAEYMKRVDNGESIEPESFVSDYPPDVAAALESYFQGVNVFQQARPPQTADASLAGTQSLSDHETIAPGNAGADDDDLSGKEFGRYQVERCLGRGAMGAVYLARDRQLGRSVALKIPKFIEKE